MRLYIFLVILTAFFIHCDDAYSKNVSSTRYGVAGNVGWLSVNDPDETTETITTTYFSGIMTKPLNRNNPSMRIWYELNYRAFDQEPSETEIGQEVKVFSLSATLQKAWGAKSFGAFWLGAGAEMNFGDYKNRHTVDGSGFLKQKYSDRSEVEFAVRLNTGMNLKRTESGYYPGINVNYHVPLDDGINGLSMSVFVLW